MGHSHQTASIRTEAAHHVWLLLRAVGAFPYVKFFRYQNVKYPLIILLMIRDVTLPTAFFLQTHNFSNLSEKLDKKYHLRIFYKISDQYS